MLRAALLAAVAAAAIASGRDARAQWIVQDPLNLVQNTVTSLNSVTTAGEAIKTVQELVRTYRVVNSHYQSFMHQPDLMSAAMQMGGLSRTYLPEAGVMADMLGATRYGGLQGAGNQFLYGSAGQYVANNRLFRSEQNDEYQQDMDQREAVTANAAAVSMEGMRDAEVRLANLDVLRARLEASQGGTDVAAVNGLIELEKTNLMVHHGNMQKVQLMLAADQNVQMQRQDQRRRRDAEDLFQSTAPASGSLQ